MQIDVISDTICPWCYIGKRRLERALEQRPDIEFEVNWRPFRLDPTVPAEGVERRAYLKKKFGDGPQSKSMGETIRAEGLSEGIEFAFEKIERTPNTLNSHRLIRWAGSAGLQDAVVERLFAGYFLEGRDIGDPAVLELIADEAGMDSVLVAELLAGDADLALVEREAGLAGEMGITGVPTFIFNSRFIISGARESELIVRLIDKIGETQEQDAISE